MKLKRLVSLALSAVILTTSIQVNSFAALVRPNAGVNTVVSTFSKYWHTSETGEWYVADNDGNKVKNVWLCDNAKDVNNSLDTWYLIDKDGKMVSAPIVKDASGNYYSLETEHNGYFGRIRTVSGTYDGIYLDINTEHNGSFGAIKNQEGIDAMLNKYGLINVDIKSSDCVYTASFDVPKYGRVYNGRTNNSTGGSEKKEIIIQAKDNVIALADPDTKKGEKVIEETYNSILDIWIDEKGTDDLYDDEICLKVENGNPIFKCIQEGIYKPESVVFIPENKYFLIDLAMIYISHDDNYINDSEYNAELHEILRFKRASYSDLFEGEFNIPLNIDNPEISFIWTPQYECIDNSLNSLNDNTITYNIANKYENNNQKNDPGKNEVLDNIKNDITKKQECGDGKVTHPGFQFENLSKIGFKGDIKRNNITFGLEGKKIILYDEDGDKFGKTKNDRIVLDVNLFLKNYKHNLNGDDKLTKESIKYTSKGNIIANSSLSASVINVDLQDQLDELAKDGQTKVKDTLWRFVNEKKIWIFKIAGLDFKDHIVLGVIGVGKKSGIPGPFPIVSLIDIDGKSLIKDINIGLLVMATLNLKFDMNAKAYIANKYEAKRQIEINTDNKDTFNCDYEVLTNKTDIGVAGSSNQKLGIGFIDGIIVGGLVPAAADLRFSLKGEEAGTIYFTKEKDKEMHMKGEAYAKVKGLASFAAALRLKSQGAIELKWSDITELFSFEKSINHVYGTVKNISDGTPMADVTVKIYQDISGEKKYIEELKTDQKGKFSCFLTNGEYRVELLKDGYKVKDQYLFVKHGMKDPVYYLGKTVNGIFDSEWFSPNNNKITYASIEEIYTITNTTESENNYLDKWYVSEVYGEKPNTFCEVDLSGKKLYIKTTENEIYAAESISSAFSGFKNLKYADLNGINTSKTLDMTYLFANCGETSSGLELNISNWDTSLVKDMFQMFRYCKNLKKVTVGEKWSTHGLERFGGMFDECVSLVGGKGTKYNPNELGPKYAHIDCGVENPGYFSGECVSVSKGGMEVLVLDQDNNIAVGETITVEKDSFKKTVTTDENGKFKLTNLEPGMYQLIATKKDAEIRETIEVKPGNITKKTITFKPRFDLGKGGMKVLVLNQDGTCAAAEKITVEKDSFKKTVTTDENGKFKLDNLDPGVYKLTVFKQDSQICETVEVVSGYYSSKTIYFKPASFIAEIFYEANEWYQSYLCIKPINCTDFRIKPVNSDIWYKDFIKNGSGEYELNGYPFGTSGIHYCLIELSGDAADVELRMITSPAPKKWHYLSVETPLAKGFPGNKLPYYFYGANNLRTVPDMIFCRISGEPDFTGTFYGCSSLERVPELWKMYPNAPHEMCFRGCENASNYADIPADWK